MTPSRRPRRAAATHGAARAGASVRGAAIALALACGATAAPAQDGDARAARLVREAASPIAVGPRLIDYPIECTEPRGCRIECFQDGRSVAARGNIGIQDEVRLVIAASTDDFITSRWLEIRPFNESGVQTLLLTDETFCDLRSLVIAPKRRP